MGGMLEKLQWALWSLVNVLKGERKCLYEANLFSLKEKKGQLNCQLLPKLNFAIRQHPGHPILLISL